MAGAGGGGGGGVASPGLGKVGGRGVKLGPLSVRHSIQTTKTNGCSKIL